jgi:photosystem II stability/assembly factor-like uncharacterized protein
MPLQFGWTVAKAPKETQLTGVESHDDEVVATGRRGVLLERTAPGEWEAVFTNGSVGNGNAVLDAAFTDDGKRAWYVGNSGVFGYYDLTTGETTSHKAPEDISSTFTSVAVTGDAGTESIYTADNSGQVLSATVDGDTVVVDGLATPGDGTTVSEVVVDDDRLYMADVSGYLYYARNGENWRRRRLAETTIKALATANSGVTAITDGGTVYRDISLFEQDQRTKQARFETSSLEELAAADDLFVIAGCDGCLVPITADGDYEHADPGPGVTYYGAEVTDDGDVIAVGSSGTIIEGRRNS